MTLVTCFCHMSSVRSTSDGRGPVTRKRVPDREKQGKPSKDARRGRCHPLEAGFWPLWMTPLPRNNSSKVQSPKSPGDGTHVQKLGTLVGVAIRSREDHSDEKITHHEVGWSPLRNYPINVRGGRVSDWEESQMLAALNR